MPQAKVKSSPATPTARKLLGWYDRHRRDLPWRAKAGTIANPYHVWLSEIMLQQTTVTAVKPFFEKFLTLWPTLADLAKASQDEVLTAWAGLGYYSRARNLHACARVLVDEFGGVFPETEKTLRTLPGIGDYTAAATAAIAFAKPATVVDGNVERVITRQFALKQPMPKVKADVKLRVSELVPKGRPGDFAQAMMDLGATVCTPRSPNCTACPWVASCAAKGLGRMEDFPVRAPKKRKPTRRGCVYFVETARGEVLLEQRADKGLLASMWQFPTMEWDTMSSRAAFSPKARDAAAPVQAEWQRSPGLVSHTFTHFHLELAVFKAKVAKGSNPDRGEFVARQDLERYALPSLMQKVLVHADASK